MELGNINGAFLSGLHKAIDREELDVPFEAGPKASEQAVKDLVLGQIDSLRLKVEQIPAPTIERKVGFPETDKLLKYLLIVMQVLVDFVQKIQRG